MKKFKEFINEAPSHEDFVKAAAELKSNHDEYMKKAKEVHAKNQAKPKNEFQKMMAQHSTDTNKADKHVNSLVQQLKKERGVEHKSTLHPDPGLDHRRLGQLHMHKAGKGRYD